MIGALWTGISGLSSQQQALDNESNNIANVNTVGFKASRISFADQMYQDRIGKGSKILDAEKLYTQGNLKLTGVNYDMALSGDGFFTVANKSSIGTAENFYTRAGNFRMGDSGTLQDAAGNEVQGWMMTSIDSQNDVTSTNPNTNVFTDDYTKLLSSKIVRHGNYVETITAKSTDYSKTAKSDSISVFSGDGAKTKSSKESDIEAAIKDYTFWLQKLKDEPDASSATSIAQTSQINFKTGSESIISKDGDQIYVYIDGNKYSQNFLLTSASTALKQELYAADQALLPANQVGYVDPALIPSLPQAQIDAANAAYDKAAGKIATYKALADTISQIPGLVATMAIDSGRADVFNENETYTASTNNIDMLKGIIQIKSLIPGSGFTISEIAEVSGKAVVQGNAQNTTLGAKGSGIGALKTSKDALAQLITGKQQDVYTPTNLNLIKSPMFQYSITVYDKELKINIPIPNDGGIPPVVESLYIDATDSNGNFTIDGFIKDFNQKASSSIPPIINYIEARNVNGNLVMQTLNSNYDVEFSGNMKQLPTYNINLNEVVDNSKYFFDLDINGNSHPIEIDYLTNNVISNTFAYQDIRDKLKLEVDAINLANPSYQLEVTEQTNGVFSIFTKNENIDFSNSTTDIQDSLLTPTTRPLTVNILSTPNLTLEKDKITVNEPLLNQIYSFEILGVSITYDNTSGIALNANEIMTSFKTQIEGDSLLNPFVIASNNDNVIGDPTEGVVLTNGLTNLVRYKSETSGKFMIEIPSGTTDLALFLHDNGANDTIQIFTKDGKQVSGTIAGHSSWGGNNKPENILSSNKFNVGAAYSDNHTLYTLNSPREGMGSSLVSYVDKDGNTQSKNLGSYDEMVVIPNVPEDLVVFINGSGAYYVSAEWGSIPSSVSTSSSLVLSQTALSDPLLPSGLNITSFSGITSEDITDFTSTSRYEHRFNIPTNVSNSSSIYRLTIEGRVIEIKTDQTPTVPEIKNAFEIELSKDIDLNEKFQMIASGNNLIIQEKFGGPGYSFTLPSTLTIRSLEDAGDKYETVVTKAKKMLSIDVNANYSGRKGAGAEFIEIINKVDQTASKGSLQLRLDTLGISDSAFGEFSVDSTGLITMKQDGAEFAVGQVAIAVFNNNRGLNPAGDNLLAKTNESGDPVYNLNNNKTAKIESKTLELSTADLSESLVNLMVFQRAFEANAKSITTSDELLNTLINLKR